MDAERGAEGRVCAAQMKKQKRKVTLKSAAVHSRVDAVLANLRRAGADQSH
jgi:hypothetical protein